MMPFQSSWALVAALVVPLAAGGSDDFLSPTTRPAAEANSSSRIVNATNVTAAVALITMANASLLGMGHPGLFSVPDGTEEFADTALPSGCGVWRTCCMGWFGWIYGGHPSGSKCCGDYGFQIICLKSSICRKRIIGLPTPLCLAPGR